jgi:hypothetical protein
MAGSSQIGYRGNLTPSLPPFHTPSQIIGTVPQAFQHPTHGRVGLHVMHRFL